MSLFTPIATFTLSDQWQFTDVLVGSYFRVVHLTQPLNQDGQLQESSAAIAQADITGFIYTQEDFSHQTDPQSFILEQPDSLEVRKIGFRLLPGQTPWNIRVEALDATLLPGSGGYSVDAIDALLALKATVTAVYTKTEVDALLALKQNIGGQSPSRPTTKNLLNYVPTAAEAYTFFEGMGAENLNDSSLSVGLIKQSGGTTNQCKILVTFPQPTYINEIKLTPGQFNGDFSKPLSFETRNPSTNDILYDADVSTYGTLTYDTKDVASFSAPLSAYLFTFKSNQDLISVLELSLYGATA